jgi:hypothetical protein
MDLKAIEKSLLHLDEYPLEQWNPKLCEGVRFDIDKDANWFYNGSKIERLNMIKLFSKLVKMEGENYFIVTPSEKIPVYVVNEVFSIIDFKKENDDYFFKTNTNEWVKLSQENCLSTDSVNDQPYPKIKLKENVFGLLTRSLFYNLIEHANNDKDRLYIMSDGKKFYL